MTREEIETALTQLKRKLKAREGMVGYAANIEAIRTRVAELEAELAKLNG